MTIPTQFFVYGTLKRGLRYESVWPCQPLSVKIAWTHGSLFNGPHYPAMKPGLDRVLGELWQFETHQSDVVTAALDQLEGTDNNSPSDLYHRLTTEVFDIDGQTLGAANLYHFVRDPLDYGFSKIPPNANNYVAWPCV